MATADRLHRVAIYGRVSTVGQEPESQLVALRAHVAQRGWQVVEEFVDVGFSGSRERRPALDRLMRAAWAGQFHAVLVWRFDRFARSVKHLVSALDTFRSMNVAFISLQEQLDTSSPIGQAMFTIIGAMAQLERDIIRERVCAGVARARAEGRRLGRPPLHRVNVARVLALRAEGRSLRAVARELNVHPMAIKRALSRASQIPSENAA